MVYLITFLLLHPSITFGLLKAEVFPYAIIFGLFFSKKYNKDLIFFLLALTFLSLISVFINKKIPVDFLRSFTAYVNPIFSIILIYSSKKIRIIIEKYAEKYLYFLIILGLIQYFNLIPYLDTFLKLLIPRATSEISEESIRGVSLLSTEPARGGLEFLFIYFYINISKKTDRFILGFIILIFILFVLKSFIVLAVFLFYLLTINFKLRYVIYSYFLFLGISFFINKIEINSRSIILIQSIWNLPFEDKLNFLVNTSGNRFASILSFYPYGMSNFWGSGVGNWELSSLQALKYVGIDPNDLNFFKYEYNIGMRGSGYLTNLILDLGISGLIIFLFFLLRIIKKISYDTKYEISFLLMFIFVVFFIGSVGTTTNWVIFFTFYFNKLCKYPVSTSG